MKWQALCWFLVSCFCTLRPAYSHDGRVEVISIIDKSCVLSSYIKIFSIIKSSKRPQALLSFRFLVLDDLNFDMLERMYKGCFPEINVQFKRWTRPSTLPPLSNKGFDSEYIYSRVYLSDIFFEVDKYVYLDNDAIVNMDIADLYNTPLIRATHPLTTRKKAPRKPTAGVLAIEANMKRSRSFTSRQTSIREDEHHKATRVAMGFVFDVNEKLRGYVKNGFTQSSPYFKQAMSFIEPAKFFNGGVALVDAKKWRMDNMTRRAEAIIIANANEELYRHGLGDQGLFFLLLQEGIAELHPAFNMRRVPNKTTRFMKNNLGIVHFAGTTQGNALTLCIDPLQYPVLSAGAVPLYLLIVKAFFDSCPTLSLPMHEGGVQKVGNERADGDRKAWLLVKETCLKAINKTRTHELEGKLRVEYLPGNYGAFQWPQPS